VRTAGNPEHDAMSALEWLAGGLAAGLVIYLFAVLLHPERFS
jgi:K+-transporting ATPase KdpF subunit